MKNQVHMLMAKYTALRKEFHLMIEENQVFADQVSEQKIKIETLEQQYNTAKLATGVLATENETKAARTEINRIVREIDDCIALLNR